MASVAEPAAKRRKTTGDGDAFVSQANVAAVDTGLSSAVLGSSEILTVIAPFLQFGPDMTSLCVVAGRSNASVIRYDYLRNNDDFLLHCHGIRGKDMSRLRLKKIKMQTWLQVNDLWRGRCQTKLPYASITISQDDDWSKLLLSESHGVIQFHESAVGQPDDDNPPKEGDIYVAFRPTLFGTEAPGDLFIDGAPERLRRMWKNSDQVTIRFARSPGFLFTESEITATFGIPELLAPALAGKEEDGAACRELIRTVMDLHLPDTDCFEYVLGLPGSRGYENTILSNLSFGDPLKGERPQTVDSLRLLLNRPKAQVPDLNIDYTDRRGSTALHKVCMCHNDLPAALKMLSPDIDFNEKVAKLQLLMEHGADPLIANNEGKLPLDVLYGTSSREDQQKDQFKAMTTLLRQGRRT